MKFKSYRDSSLLYIAITLLLMSALRAKDHGKDAKDKESSGKDGDSTKSTEKEKAPKNICNKDILNKIGLEGLKSAHTNKMRMCPSIKQSCCTLKDQKKIYKLWANTEGPRLEKNLKVHENIYSDLLDVMALIDNKAKHTKGKTQDTENECLILSNAIDKFHIDDTTENIRPKLELHYKKLVEFHKGVYCMLCDFESHSHIHVDKKQIVISERACRDFVGNSLNFLLYFYSHIPKILNILSLFILNCDSEANYTDKKIPPDYLFDIKEDIDALLLHTIEKRNEKGWVKDFTKVCTRAKLTEITTFMMPNLKKIEKYVKKIRGIIMGSGRSKDKSATLEQPEDEEKEKNDEEEKDDESKSKEDEKNGSKEDDDEDSDNEADEEKPKKKSEIKINVYETFKIFEASFKDDMPLDELKFAVAENGIDITSISKASKINKEALKQIDEDIKVEKGEASAQKNKDKNKGKNKDKNKDKDDDKNKNDDKEKDADKDKDDDDDDNNGKGNDDNNKGKDSKSIKAKTAHSKKKKMTWKLNVPWALALLTLWLSFSD